MPKITLYVKDASTPLWDRARKLAGGTDSLSGIVTEALAAYVPEEEARRRAEKQIGKRLQPHTFELHGAAHDGYSQTLKFIGAELAQTKLIGVSGARELQGGTGTLFVTKGRNLVLVEDRGKSGTTVRVSKTFTEFVRDHGSKFKDQINEIAAAVGDDFSWRVE